MKILIDICTVFCRMKKKIAQVCIYSLGYFVELTFFEGKLGVFVVVKVLKSSYKELSSDLNLLSHSLSI